MALGLRRKENSNLGAREVQRLSRIEVFAGKRLAMQEVREFARNLAESHQDDFSVTYLVNETLSNVQATTAFDVEGHALTLSIGITNWRNGNITHEVNIRPERGSWSDDDAISYRLDIEMGKAAQAEYSRFSELDVSSSDDPQTAEIKRSIREIMLSFFDVESGDLTRYADNYAESTIKAEGAVWLLRMAKQLHRPKDWGYESGVSLRQFRQMIEDERKKGGKVTGLLGASF